MSARKRAAIRSIARSAAKPPGIAHQKYALLLALLTPRSNGPAWERSRPTQRRNRILYARADATSMMPRRVMSRTVHLGLLRSRPMPRPPWWCLKRQSSLLPEDMDQASRWEKNGVIGAVLRESPHCARALSRTSRAARHWTPSFSANVFRIGFASGTSSSRSGRRSRSWWSAFTTSGWRRSPCSTR